MIHMDSYLKVSLVICNLLIIIVVLLFSDDQDIYSHIGSYAEKDKNRKVQGAELCLNRLLLCLIIFYFVSSLCLYYQDYIGIYKNELLS